MEQKLTHLDSKGNAAMVDIGEKVSTKRTAVAGGKITMSRECFAAVRDGGAKKGDVLGTARIAGIMAAKKTAELIPLCHSLALTSVKLDFSLDGEERWIQVRCSASTTGQTGVEMEALTGACVALLTVYDMCKALDKSMVLGEICLLEKSGGKSGDFRRAAGESTSSR